MQYRNGGAFLTMFVLFVFVLAVDAADVPAALWFVAFGAPA
jgi:hypothetical protein